MAKLKRNIFSSSEGTITLRSTTGTRSRLTCWESTAATSPPRPSYRRGLPSTSSLCLTMPTRGRASLCATKSTKQVRKVILHSNGQGIVSMCIQCAFYNKTFWRLNFTGTRPLKTGYYIPAYLEKTRHASLVDQASYISLMAGDTETGDMVEDP